MAEVDEVLGHGAGAATVVDVHARAVDVGREVDEDVGQPASADRLEALVVLGRAEHDVAVDERGAHELRRALGQLRERAPAPVPCSSQPAATPERKSTAAGSSKM